MANTTERSAILLLCLGLDTDKTEVKKVDVCELRSIFGEYGKLHKVIIFTKKTLLKGFLEFYDINDAIKAKEAVHEQCVKNYGKARLYYSPLQNLEKSNKYLEYWDDSEEKAESIDGETSTKCSLKSSIYEKQIPVAPKRTLPVKQENEECYTRNRYSIFSQSSMHKNEDWNRDSYLSEKNFVFAPLRQHCNLKNIDTTNPIKSRSLFFEPTKQVNNKLETSSLSKVVLISNLNHVFKNAEELFNLFSAFGNISTILFMKNLQKSLIEFTDSKYASEAVSNLNNFAIADTVFRISFSKYQSIDLTKNNKNENSLQFNEVMIVPPMRNRYKPYSELAVKSLSSNLLISFPKNKNVDTIDVYMAIGQRCKPSKVKLVNTKDVISRNEVVSMLFSFEDIQSAVYVIFMYHNSIIKGVLLDVCFF